MCGICGAFALDGALDPAVRNAVPAMTAALRHRGPDGDGVFSDDRAALGHRRLAILDRAGGAQPMANEDGTCWIVFNGEIYNHKTLRGHLMASGHRFWTTSDTEAILHAYEECGPACVERLEVRCPLLDRRVVEFAFRIPTKRKLASLNAKHLLRALARRRLPSALASQPKRGLTVPIGDWIAGPYRAKYQSEVLRGGSLLIDLSRLRTSFDEHCRGQRDWSYLLWAVWVLQRWLADAHRPSRTDGLASRLVETTA